VVLFWYPIFVPLLKYLQKDDQYLSQVMAVEKFAGGGGMWVTGICDCPER